MITHYIVIEIVFVVIVYKLLAQKKILKCHVKNCFKINGNKMIKMPKKGKYFRFKNYERKIKSPIMIYVDFESILVPEHNKKQNPDEFLYEQISKTCCF